MSLMNLNEARDYIDMIHGPPLKIIADSLRGFITARPGNRLIAVDFSSIEARFLSWLASQDDKLELFREGKDIYISAATKIYGVRESDVTKDQRLVGKVSELALGYQGGVKAFQSMAKNYFLKIADEQAEDIKVRWREGNQAIVSYWFRLEDAAIAANRCPGEKFHVGVKNRHVTFLKKGSFLMCRLPSGRVLFYPYPKMALVRTPWGEKKNALTYKGETNRKFIRQVAYGGLLAENITQATSRDLLRDAMFRWESHGYPVVMHVHDELVAEVPLSDKSKTLKEAEKLMCQPPAWCSDLPISAEGWEGIRYRK